MSISIPGKVSIGEGFSHLFLARGTPRVGDTLCVTLRFLTHAEEAGGPIVTNHPGSDPHELHLLL